MQGPAEAVSDRAREFREGTGTGTALSGQDLHVILRYQAGLAVQRALEPARLLRAFHCNSFRFRMTMTSCWHPLK